MVRLVVGMGAALAAVGIMSGLGAAALTARGLAAMLYGLGPRDPVTFGVAAAVVGIATLLVCYLPARRAARVDPAELLRAE